MSRRILVVDDERQMVRTLCDILALAGWEADPAYSGEEAIARVREHPYAAVLMDVKMGGMNGVDAMKTLRSIRRGLPVILMTAYTASDLIAEAEREGALKILAKPVAIPSLLEMLGRAAEDARRVLIVDDDAQFLATLGTVVREHGYTVLQARSLDEALAHLEGTRPATVILDLRLGTVAPLDSIIAIRQVSPTVILILCSGHDAALNEAVEAMPRSWIAGSLRKPFPPDRLLALLDDVVAA
jgi:DNA-binding NtrC family response regulator